MPHLGMTELLIVLAILLLLFGAKKVPELARSLGQGMKEFKQGLREAALAEADTALVAGASPASESRAVP